MSLVLSLTTGCGWDTGAAGWAGGTLAGGAPPPWPPGTIGGTVAWRCSIFCTSRTQKNDSQDFQNNTDELSEKIVGDVKGLFLPRRSRGRRSSWPPGPAAERRPAGGSAAACSWPPGGCSAHTTGDRPQKQRDTRYIEPFSRHLHPKWLLGFLHSTDLKTSWETIIIVV